MLSLFFSFFCCQGVGGADANGVDSRLLSCLHLVALFNRPDVARVLLMCGASPKLVGGVTRAAAARGGKLWSPLEMAEEACTEGGELDDGENTWSSYLCRAITTSTTSSTWAHEPLEKRALSTVHSPRCEP